MECRSAEHDEIKIFGPEPAPRTPPPGPRQARMGLLDLGRRHGHLAPPGGPRVVAPTPRWPATLGSKPGRSPEAGGPVGAAQGAAGAAQGRHFKIYQFFKFFYTKLYELQISKHLSIRIFFRSYSANTPEKTT